MGEWAVARLADGETRRVKTYLNGNLRQWHEAAMAGLPFRVVAIPGLVEGGYPGVFRPDPFLSTPSARR